MAHTEDHRPGPSGPIGHETSDADLGGVERLVFITLAFLACVFALIYVVYFQLKAREARLDTPPPAIAQRQGDRLPPLPRLQTTPVTDLKRFRETEDEVLNAYRWVDRPAGIAQVPVARAIELIAEHGLPPRPAPPAPAVAAPGASTAQGAPAAAAEPPKP
jgi:hypothetical protein